MAWYTVTVMMVGAYSVEADTTELAEMAVQKELPSDVYSVNIIAVELEE